MRKRLENGEQRRIGLLINPESAADCQWKTMETSIRGIIADEEVGSYPVCFAVAAGADVGRTFSKFDLLRRLCCEKEVVFENFE